VKDKDENKVEKVNISIAQDDAETRAANFTAQVNEWRNEYGKVYKTIFEDYEFYWRKLRRKEYTLLASEEAAQADKSFIQKTFSRQEKMVQIAVLYPNGEELDKIIEENGYIASALSEEILGKSGFSFVATIEV
jgi:hypothetical protein